MHPKASCSAGLCLSSIRAFSYEPGWRDQFGLSVRMVNLIPISEMGNVQKALKIPVEPRSDISATLQAMRS